MHSCSVCNTHAAVAIFEPGLRAPSGSTSPAVHKSFCVLCHTNIRWRIAYDFAAARKYVSDESDWRACECVWLETMRKNIYTTCSRWTRRRHSACISWPRSKRAKRCLFLSGSTIQKKVIQELSEPCAAVASHHNTDDGHSRIAHLSAVIKVLNMCDKERARGVRSGIFRMRYIYGKGRIRVR